MSEPKDSFSRWNPVSAGKYMPADNRNTINVLIYFITNSTLVKYKIKDYNISVLSLILFADVIK